MTEEIRVLVGSPVREPVEVLREFLRSLEELDTSGLSVDVVLIDDNDDRQASATLAEWAGNDCHRIVVKPVRSGKSYVRDEVTHRWDEELIWRVAELKDAILETARDHRYDYVFLVDADLVLRRPTLQHLIRCHRDVISEIFWTRWQPDSQSLPQVWVTDQYQLYFSPRNVRLSDAERAKRTEDFLSRLQYPGQYRVGGLGACTLISRNALDRGVSFHEVYNLPWWGEDRHFCIRAAAAGLELFVDTQYPAYHIYRTAELAGVTRFRENGVMLDSVIDVSARALESIGSLDYRTVTGREGVEFMTPELAAQVEADAPKLRQQVLETKLDVRATVTGVKLEEDDRPSGVVTVTCRVERAGVRAGRPFKDASLVRLSLKRSGERWLVAGLQPGTVRAWPEPDHPSRPVLPPAPLIRRRNHRLTLGMLTRNEAGRYLAAVLKQAAEFVDDAVIVDDASDDDTVEVCRNSLKGLPLTIHVNHKSGFSNEPTVRQQLWRLIESTDPEWVLILDADEMFEDRAVEVIRSLIEDTTTYSYCFRLYDFWDQNHYREDQYWRAHLSYRPFMVRYVRGFPYEWNTTAQHCGRFPRNILDLPYKASDLRVKHLGWATPEDRQRKYLRYKELDPGAQYGIKAQYDSILDTNPRLLEWVERDGSVPQAETDAGLA